MLEKIAQLDHEAQTDLATVTDPAGLEQFRIKYLGAKGALKNLMGLLKDIPAEQKPAFGQKANALRQKVQGAFDAKKAALGAPAPGSGAGGPGTAGPRIDITEPGRTPIPGGLGRAHIITQTIDDLIDVFGRMGFDVATGPEVEDEWHNFIALNIPEAHPARDPLDNFYLTGREGQGPRAKGQGEEKSEERPPGRAKREEREASAPGAAAATAEIRNQKSEIRNPSMHLLRSQTSTIQIRVMEKTQPPVRVVAMGRVYRPDEHDATHYSMFHQVEGLCVDRRVSLVDLKTTLFQFARAYFGPEAELRLTPSFFPFTEPSAEMAVKIQLQGQWRWMELGGCGMVHPAVLESVGYDSEKWTGFAFGLGIERLAMKKYGIQDIRWLFENDVRFLRQF